MRMRLKISRQNSRNKRSGTVESDLGFFLSITPSTLDLIFATPDVEGYWFRDADTTEGDHVSNFLIFLKLRWHLKKLIMLEIGIIFPTLQSVTVHRRPFTMLSLSNYWLLALHVDVSNAALVVWTIAPTGRSAVN